MDLDFPVVLVDRAGPTGGQDAVGIDNAEAAGLLVDHLVAKGHRRIVGFFGNTSSTAAERHAGYAAAMARHGLPTDACFLPPVAEAAEAELMRRISAAERPDAVMVSNGLMLLGLYRGVRRAGLETPRDIAIAGFDNEAWTELVGPGLTVIEQPVADIGRAAMDLLFERLRTPDMATRKVVLAGRLVVRGSSGARDPAADTEAPSRRRKQLDRHYARDRFLQGLMHSAARLDDKIGNDRSWRCLPVRGVELNLRNGSRGRSFSTVMLIGRGREGMAKADLEVAVQPNRPRPLGVEQPPRRLSHVRR